MTPMGMTTMSHHALALVRSLEGLPVLEAVMILHRAEEMLRSAARVDTTTPDFQYIVKALETQIANHNDVLSDCGA